MIDPSKVKEFADHNYIFDEYGRKFLKQVEKTVGKGEIAHSNFSIFYRVFKTL